MVEKDVRGGIDEILTDIQFDIVKLRNDLSREAPFPEVEETFSTIIDRLVDDIKPLYDELEDKNRSEEHTSELQSRFDLVCRLLLEKKKTISNSGRQQIRL